jgi:hypothetical protein
MVAPRVPQGRNTDTKNLVIIGAVLLVAGLLAFVAIQLISDDKPKGQKQGAPAGVGEPSESGDVGDTPEAVDPNAVDPARAAYIQKADRLCAVTNAKIRALPEPGNSAELGSYYARTSRLFEKLVAQIKRLERPAEGRKLLERMFATLDKAVAGTRELPALVTAGNELAVKALNNKIFRLTEKANAQAVAYGLVTCSEP